MQGSSSLGQVMAGPSHSQEDGEAAHHTRYMVAMLLLLSACSVVAGKHTTNQTHYSAGPRQAQGQNSRPIILITTVDIGEGRTSQIKLRDGDSPQVVTCSQYSFALQ